jgi:hypothetical protein
MRDAGAAGKEVDLGVPVIHVPFIHENVELAKLESVVRGVEVVGVVVYAKLDARFDDAGDGVVNGH